MKHDLHARAEVRHRHRGAASQHQAGYDDAGEKSVVPVLELEVGLVGQGQKPLQQPPAQQQDQTEQQIPADDEMFAPLDCELDVGQRGGDQRNEKRDENADPKAMKQKGNKLLLLQLLTADCLALAVDREIPL